MSAAGAKAALAATRFHDLHHYAEVDSTNRMLVDMARGGAPEGRVVVADHQTAGRGRLGRQWHSPPGASLLMSVLLRPELDAEQLHLVTVAVALAASDACEEVAGFRPGLKWPNDLVVVTESGFRKLGGILAETDLQQTRPAFVVVGLGLNVNWTAPPPPDLVDTAIAANHVAGHAVDRDALLVGVLLALEARYRALTERGGAAPLLDDYRASCSTLGRMVTVELAGEVVVGTAVDVTAQAHLVVALDGGRTVTVTAGDVLHVRQSGVEVPGQQLGEGG